MGIRLKLFLLFFALGFVPMLALNLFNYFYGVRTAESLLRAEVERNTSTVVRNVETALRERETQLTALARSQPLREYVRAGAKRSEAAAQGAANRTTAPVASNTATAPTADASVPEAVATQMKAFFLGNQKYYAAITCLDQTGSALFRLEPATRDAEVLEPSSLRFQTADFLSGLAPPDPRVWKVAETTPLHSQVERESYGAMIRYTVPVFLRWREHRERTRRARRRP